MYVVCTVVSFEEPIDFQKKMAREKQQIKNLGLILRAKLTCGRKIAVISYVEIIVVAIHESRCAETMCSETLRIG